tara:strand:+ start:135 stop:275 length:141 start_codon:yes stop_codon:yes gene_type:complete
MIKEIKKWLINLSNEMCSETVDTASEICSKTKKANADFVKAIMSSI